MAQQGMQKKLFNELGLSPELLKAVERMGFEEASPIQSETIPLLLAGHDLVGQSQTGSGKTAAFALPAIEKVDPQLRAPQVLILCPTRELAVQVAEEVSKLASFKKGVRELPIYGGQSYERQFRGLTGGAQIIIGTPGRVIDHLNRGTLKLGAIKMMILDEADRMLDMGFREDIESILAQAPPERQTVFFSATVPRPIQQMIERFAREPKTVRIEAQQMEAPTIEQAYYEVGHRSKLEVLCRLVDLHDFKLGIIFCATKVRVDELTEHLSAQGYAADKLHGDMTQAMRERVMRRFRERKVEFLVATDVAARGIDVNDVEVVFNYDLPQDPEDYVHRIGRTGRAGRAGRAITFVAGREIYRIQQILRYTRGRIKREQVPTLDVVEEKRAASLMQAVRETLEAGEYRKQDVLIDQLLDQSYTSTDIISALLHLLSNESGRPGERIPEDDPRAAAAAGSRGSYPQYTPGRGPAGAGSAPSASRESRPPAPRAGRPLREHGPESESRPPRERSAPGAEEASRVSHEPGMVRLAFNTGREHGIEPGDVVGVIAGVAKLPRDMIGAIKLLPRQALVDVAEEQAGAVLEKLSGIRFKGHKLQVAPATDVAPQGPRKSAAGDEPRKPKRVYGDGPKPGGPADPRKRSYSRE